MKSWARERPPTRPARGSTDAATLTRIQVPVEGHSQGNPGQKRGEVGGETVPDGDYRSVQKEGNTPSGPSARPGPPRAGLLGVAPAPPRARRRYQRLFTRTMPASPPLDNPVSLLHRFFRNSSNICIMRSRFPRPPPLACAHTRTPAHAHSRAPPAPLRQRPRAARPGPAPAAQPPARSLTWSAAGPPSAGSRQPSGSAGAALSCFQYMGRAAGALRPEPRRGAPGPPREQGDSGGAGSAAPGPAKAPAPGPRAAGASSAAAAAASEQGPDKLGESPAPSPAPAPAPSSCGVGRPAAGAPLGSG